MADARSNRTTVRVLCAAVLVCAVAGRARADIFAREDADGVISFTDAPLTADYQVVIRERRPAPPETHTAAKPWSDIARREAERKKLDPLLVKAVIQVESGENPTAVSTKGAKGLMQLMPDTAEALGVEDPLQPKDNIRGGVEYLSKMLERFGRLDLALAAYNAGPGAVERHRGIPPYRETRNYVSKVMDAYRRLSGSIMLDTTLAAVDNPLSTAGRE